METCVSSIHKFASAFVHRCFTQRAVSASQNLLFAFAGFMRLTPAPASCSIDLRKIGCPHERNTQIKQQPYAKCEVVTSNPCFKYNELHPFRLRSAWHAMDQDALIIAIAKCTEGNI